jgi:electron transfer flavoprotein alpha subunit
VRFVVVLDGTVTTAARQARALAAFLRDGLGDTSGQLGGVTEAGSAGLGGVTEGGRDELGGVTGSGEPAGETLIFYADDGDKRRLVDLAPTRDVRLVKTTARRPDLMVDDLVALGARTHSAGPRTLGGEIALVLTAGGATGAELATRLACRTGGAVLTDALSIEVGPRELRGRRTVYSNHLTGRFALTTRPWCVSIDASWNDRPRSPSLDPALEHDVLSDTDETGGAHATPFEDVELVAAPSTDDLAESRFLVVAGYGAGSREATERIAQAARRMGACFGASRPVVMNAWAPPDRLIGVSGTRTAPVLCIVVGASGAPALSWGVERAGFIVAINPDGHAPIVGNADAAVLDDGLAVIEALAEIVAPDPTLN